MKGKRFCRERHTRHAWEGQKGEEEAPLAGGGDVYAEWVFLEMSQALSPSAGALPQTPPLSVQHLPLLRWRGTALPSACDAPHAILSVHRSVVCRYGGKRGKGEHGVKRTENECLCTNKTLVSLEVECGFVHFGMQSRRPIKLNCRCAFSSVLKFCLSLFFFFPLETKNCSFSGNY